MAEILKGAPVAAALQEHMANDIKELEGKGVIPTLCILRVGERPDDLSYERSAMKKAGQIGINVVNKVLPEDVSQEEFDKTLEGINSDDSIHGILMFRPLPKQLDEEKAMKMLAPEKDVDGCTDASLAGVFKNTKTGFPPCTAQAVMEILKYYDIDITGKKACVVGRSLVIGRPVAMMLMHENATVVNCHTKTRDPQAIAREADILVCASGRLHGIGVEYTNPDQVVIDVGINWDEARGGISGDCDFDTVEPNVKAITPVPGGVGGVTSVILMKHVVEAAGQAAQKKTPDIRTGEAVKAPAEPFVCRNYKGVRPDDTSGTKEAVIERIIDKLIETNDIELPSDIDDEIDYVFKGTVQNMRYQNMFGAGRGANDGIDFEQIREDASDEVIREYKTEQILKSIIEQEKFDCTAKELEEAAKKIAEKQDTTLDLVKKFMGEDYSLLKGDLLKEKARDLLYDNMASDV